MALQANAVIPNFPSFVAFTINCMFLNSLVYVLFRDIYIKYGRLQQREKSTRRQGHPCLRFVHDFVSVVFDTRNSCGWRHLSTKRTAMRPLRGQNFLRGSQPLKYCFDLYSSRLYLENLAPCPSPFMMYPFYSSNTTKREKARCTYFKEKSEHA